MLVDEVAGGGRSGTWWWTKWHMVDEVAHGGGRSGTGWRMNSMVVEEVGDGGGRRSARPSQEQNEDEDVNGVRGGASGGDNHTFRLLLFVCCDA